MYDLAKEGLVLAHAQTDFMIAVIRNYHKRDFVDVGGMKVAMPKDPRLPQPGLHCNPCILWQLKPGRMPHLGHQPVQGSPAMGLVHG